MSEPITQHRFTVSYQGFNLEIVTPPMSVVEAEWELQQTLFDKTYKFVSKDWKTPVTGQWRGA